MAANLTLDAIGIGIKTPLQFVNGRLALTARNTVVIPSDDGLGEVPGGSVEVLMATNEEQVGVIRQSMRRIVETRRGSRFFFGDFGSLLDTIVMDPNDETTHSLAISMAAMAVAEHEPRVSLVHVEAIADPARPEVVKGLIGFRFRGQAIVETGVVFERSAA